MQVSWIEPDELRDLANLLLDPEPAERVVPVEVHTLPEASSVEVPLLPELSPDSNDPVGPPAQMPSPELEQIRERLRVIRDRAQDAGLLPVAKVTETVAPSPEVIPELAPIAVPQQAPVEPPAPEAIAPSPSPWPAKEEEKQPESPAPTQSGRFLPLEGTLTERLNSYANWAIQYAGSNDMIILDDHGAPLWGNPAHNDLAVSAMLALATSQRSSATGHNTDVILHTNLGAGKELSIFRCLSRYGVVSVATVGNHPLADETVNDLRAALTLAIDEASV